MKLKPQCSWCKNYNDFEENTQLRVLVLCFKKLCEYISHSPIGEDLRSLTTNGETNNLVTIIQEALDFYDEFHLQTLSIPFLFGAPEPSLLTNKSNESVPSTSKESETKSRKQEVTEVCQYSNSELSDTSEKADEKVEKIQSAAEITHIVHHDLSPVSSDEIIDVCKTPSPIEKDKHSKKKKSVLSFDKTKNTSILEQKVLLFNCVKEKGAQKLATPVVDLAVKKPKVVLTNTKQTNSKGCKCGRGGTNSRLTCLGQRCPCYIKKLPCIGCRCTGCRNPRKAANHNGSSASLNHSVIDDRYLQNERGIVPSV
ncbi:hypothetical protein FSP39_003255 [Pinctada imbricata]|uniref:CXC MSL2-type domain-containing protein n=1 Tax=Pinctada imbricata TaxID=66713 RepID=A0AA88YDK6_PINIB|nr:hypothetical protein FSP39_003255 [Pinctada imbricata]